jgi:hypothetical protein
MTPQERDLVTQLFNRLAGLEGAPRDPDAERIIIEGLRHAPNATYALVQTVLVQDEALRRADARIQELEGGPEGDPGQPTGFLDNMREALLGRRETPRAGSVPSVRPGQTSGPEPGAPGPQAGAAPWPQAQPPAGGSFLGTAASAAAGVIGGSLLLDGIRSMMGHGHGAAFGAVDPGFGARRDVSSPWTDTGNDELSRQAGIDHIGQGGRAESFGNFDSDADDAPDQQADEDLDDDGSDDDGDFGNDFGDSGDFGGSDAA